MHHSITNIPLALGTTVLFKLLLLSGVQLLQYLFTNSFFISKDLFESSSVVLVSTYCQSDTSTSVSESKYTASDASNDEIATIQYKPVMSLAGNNVLAHYKQSRGYNQILPNIYGLYRCKL